MPGVRKNWVYLLDVPAFIREHAKEGLDHYEMDVLDTAKRSRERVEIRFWKKKAQLRRMECPGTQTEECQGGFNGTNKFANPQSLEVHQRAKHHGPYQMVTEVLAK